MKIFLAKVTMIVMILISGETDTVCSQADGWLDGTLPNQIIVHRFPRLVWIWSELYLTCVRRKTEWNDGDQLITLTSYMIGGWNYGEKLSTWVSSKIEWNDGWKCWGWSVISASVIWWWWWWWWYRWWRWWWCWWRWWWWWPVISDQCKGEMETNQEDVFRPLLRMNRVRQALTWTHFN